MKTVANKFASPMFPGDSATMPNAERRTPKELRKSKSEPNPPRPAPISIFGFRASFGFRVSGFGFLQVPPRCAFTLIELLTVIAIIGVIAALILPVAGAVKKHQYLYNTQAEMEKVATAIDRYKAAYGFYPPDNPGNLLTHQLYFELVGTTNNNSVYQTLDGSAQMSASQFINAFGPGVVGFMNCSKPGGGEDSSVARNFLPDLKPKQMATLTNSLFTNIVLVASVGGPDPTYRPLGTQNLNPWRYNSSSPTNNPGSYDLWVQLSIGGKTNLICNWTKQVQVNSPLP